MIFALPFFLAACCILMFSIYNKNGLDIIRRYFAWANQVLAAVTLWAITVFLYKEHKPYPITLIPALFMTMVCSTYLLISPEGFNLNHTLSYCLGGCITLLILIIFIIFIRKQS